MRLERKDLLGIEELSAKIQNCLGVTDFDTTQPICVTVRQQNLLTDLTQADTCARAKDIIQDLLNGAVSV